MQTGLPNVWHECESGACTGEMLYTVTAKDFVTFGDQPRDIALHYRNAKGQFETYRGPIPTHVGTYIPHDLFKQPEATEPPYPPMPEFKPPCPECFWALTDSSWCSRCGWGCNIITEDKP